MSLITLSHYQVDNGWRWKDQADNYHSPKNMETRHLFYTLRMIWNHTMGTKIEPYKKYRFGRFYTPDYMRKAVIAIGQELMKRDNLQPKWKAELEFMASNFTKEQPKIKEPA